MWKIILAISQVKFWKTADEIEQCINTVKQNKMHSHGYTHMRRVQSAAPDLRPLSPSHSVSQQVPSSDFRLDRTLIKNTPTD